MHSPKVRALALALPVPQQSPNEVASSLSELSRLAAGVGLHVVHALAHRRQSSASASPVGEGKLHELCLLVADEKVEVVLVDGALSPGQQRRLEQALGVEVLDRTALILRTFEHRAGSRVARLEVELARLQYELPRVRDDRSHGDREGGGGRGGRGDSNVDLAKQRLRARISALQGELTKLQTGPDRRRGRGEGLGRVALVGYTNAGKSSLMRALTGSDVLVEDRLFATLGTTVRPLSPPAAPPILVADTVGFVRNLPTELVASFRSTLDEASDAGLLLLVVDGADPDWREQLRVSRETLRSIGVEDSSCKVVLNKVDRLTPEGRDLLAAELPEALQICAHAPGDVGRLREVIIETFDALLVTRTLEVPWARAGVIAEWRGQLRVVSEEFGAQLILTVRAHPTVLARLERRLSG